MTDLLFDEYYEKYNEILTKNQRILAPSGKGSYFAQHKVSILKRILPLEPHTILEYGCGIGNNMGFILENFPNAAVWGCDTSQKSLEVAGKRYPQVRFFPVLGEELVQYDCVLVWDVVHHIAREKRAYYLERIAKFIRPGGYCLFFEHNPYNPVTKRFVSTCVFDALAELISLRNLRDIAEAAGLEVRAAGYCCFFPEFLQFLNRLEGALTWLPLGGKYYILAVRAG